MDSSFFFVKKTLLFSTFLCVFLLYLNIRPTIYEFNKSSILKQRIRLLNSCYDSRLGIEPYFTSVKRVYIKYDRTCLPIENAILLVRNFKFSYLNFKNIGTLDLCSRSTDDPTNCVKTDISDFIKLYFDQSQTILDYLPHNKCYMPKSDRNITDDEYKSLGVMIGLALLTQTFINKTFCSNIAPVLTPDSRYFTYTSLLEEFDKNQFQILNEIRNDTSDTCDKVYSTTTNPNSRIVFLGKSDMDGSQIDSEGFEILNFPSNHFPIGVVLHRIFHFERVEEGIAEVFEHLKIINQSPVLFNIHSYGTRIDFKYILSPGNEVVTFESWRTHSLIKRPKRDSVEFKFWKSLRKFSPEEIRKIFTILTGIEYLPKDQFLRLPKTSIVSVNRRTKVVPDLLSFDKVRFIVYIRSDCDLETVENELRKLLRHE